MKIFGVTENELRTLTIVNAALAALFSLGTGCFGYLLNLKTEVALNEKIPAQTVAMLDIVEPLIMWLGIAFYILGIGTWIMRRGFISTIKRESNPQLRQSASANRMGKLGRIWAAIIS